MMNSSSGSYRSGLSLSSSSNLSALAPPFKVDKSLTKPNSTNPSMNLSESIYGTLFEPAGQFWNSSSTSSLSGPKFVTTEPIGTNTTFSPSPTNYGYPGSCYVSPNTGPLYDSFSYDQFPKPVSTTVEEASNPYYSPYVSPQAQPQKDGYLSLGVVSGPGYDLLSNSGSAYLDGCGSSQLDHKQGMSSGLEFKPKRGNYWSGENDSEHGKWKEYAPNFGPKEFSFSDIPSNKSHLFVDGSTKSHPFVDGSNNISLFGDGSNKSHLMQGTYVTQDSCSPRDVATISDNSFDIFGGGYPFGRLGVDQQDRQPLFNFKQNSEVTSSDCSRMPNFVFASPSKESPHLQEPVMELVTSFRESQNPSSSSFKETVSQTSPYVFGSTSATNTFPITMKLNSMANDEANRSSQKEPQVSLGSKSQSRIVIRRPISIVETIDACDEIKLESKVPNRFSSDGFNPETNDSQAIYSPEKHSEASDIHNPGEDSPCWKGASSTRFSLFGVSHAVSPDVLVKKLDECKSSSTREPQRNALLIETSNSINFSSEKVNKSTFLERPLVSDCTSKDLEDRSHVNHKSLCFDLNKTKDDFDSEIPSAVQQIFKEGDILSDDLSNIGKKRSNSSPGDKASLNYFQSTKQDSYSSIDVNFLLKSITKLSEMFRCYCCSNPAAALTEQNFVTIKHIIENLNAPVLMTAGKTTPTGEVLPEGPSFLEKLPVTEAVNNAKALAAAVRLGSKNGDFLDSVFTKDDANKLGVDNMTEAIKNILQENLCEEEVEDPQLLYKNLWLEAEAALCAVTAKARFHHMKIGLERTHNMTKDRENSPRSLISSDVHRAVEIATKDKDSPTMGDRDYESPKSSAINTQGNHTELSFINKFHVPNSELVSLKSKFEGRNPTRKEVCFPSLYVTSPDKISGNHSNGSGVTNHANDVETSVLARYQILKGRVDNSDSPNHEVKQSLGEENYSPDQDSWAPDKSGSDSLVSGTTSHANDVENSFLGRYQILKGRVDNSDSLQYEGKQSPREENYSPKKDSSSPDKQFENSELFGSIGVSDDVEASIISRFRIIQSRINYENNKDLTQGQSNRPIIEDGTWSQQKYGPYPEFNNDGNGEVLTQSCKANMLSGEIFEGWYDCSSTDWEHVLKEDIRRRN